MPEPTQTTPTINTPRAYGWCYWHSGLAEDIRLISVVEQGSGPGGVLFACQPCMRQHNLTPFAD